MGGKSRKSGGVSKALIDRIKRGGNKPVKKKCCGTNKPKTNGQESLFDLAGK